MSKVWTFSALSPTSSAPATIRPGFSQVLNPKHFYKQNNLLLSKKQGKPVVERVQWFCGIPRHPACLPSALYKMISRELHSNQLRSHLLVHHW